MLNAPNWQAIDQQIEQATQQAFISQKISPVSGGSINASYILQGKKNSYFVKFNQAKLHFMFEAEFIGLKEIAQSNTVLVPQPITQGVLADQAFLVLEKVSFISGNRLSETKLAHQLADLHKIKQAFFGWHHNNTIGSTTQINTASDDWIIFWRDNRLGYQLSLAESKGYTGKLIESGRKLAESLDNFFSHYRPQASLLHGDLWSGNASVTHLGMPIIYDPACYYGDREADIAMTELFGGFSANFYAAYNEVFPLDSGYGIRKTLYNLYHILNHLNLFGESYQHQAKNMINYLLSEIS